MSSGMTISIQSVPSSIVWQVTEALAGHKEASATGGSSAVGNRVEYSVGGVTVGTMVGTSLDRAEGAMVGTKVGSGPEVIVVVGDIVGAGPEVAGTGTGAVVVGAGTGTAVTGEGVAAGSVAIGAIIVGSAIGAEVTVTGAGVAAGSVGILSMCSCIIRVQNASSPSSNTLSNPDGLPRRLCRLLS